MMHSSATTPWRTSPVPVLLYIVTMYTGVNLSPDAVARLSTHPNIAGMKESAADIAQISQVVSGAPEGFSVLAGSATTFFAALVVGACGGVLALSAVVPDLCVQLYEWVQQRRYDDARALQQRLTPLARLLGAAHGVSGVKLPSTGRAASAARRGRSVRRGRSDSGALALVAAVGGPQLART
jgi:4-hydroxy-2-oxoglutarate aldolase